MGRGVAERAKVSSDIHMYSLPWVSPGLDFYLQFSFVRGSWIPTVIPSKLCPGVKQLCFAHLALTEIRRRVEIFSTISRPRQSCFKHDIPTTYRDHKRKANEHTI